MFGRTSNQRKNGQPRTRSLGIEGLENRQLAATFNGTFTGNFGGTSQNGGQQGNHQSRYDSIAEMVRESRGGGSSGMRSRR